MKIFAKRLRELRQEKGLSLVKLGEVLGLSHVSILRYEQNEAEPKQEMLNRIADYFGVSVDYLLGRTDY